MSLPTGGGCRISASVDHVPVDEVAWVSVKGPDLGYLEFIHVFHNSSLPDDYQQFYQGKGRAGVGRNPGSAIKEV